MPPILVFVIELNVGAPDTDETLISTKKVVDEGLNVAFRSPVVPSTEPPITNVLPLAVKHAPKNMVDIEAENKITKLLLLPLTALLETVIPVTLIVGCVYVYANNTDIVLTKAGLFA
jgi:hypothetical protein